MGALQPSNELGLAAIRHLEPLVDRLEHGYAVHEDLVRRSRADIVAIERMLAEATGESPRPGVFDKLAQLEAALVACIAQGDRAMQEDGSAYDSRIARLADSAADAAAEALRLLGQAHAARAAAADSVAQERLRLLQRAQEACDAQRDAWLAAFGKLEERVAAVVTAAREQASSAVLTKLSTACVADLTRMANAAVKLATALQEQHRDFADALDEHIRDLECERQALAERGRASRRKRLVGSAVLTFLNRQHGAQLKAIMTAQQQLSQLRADAAVEQAEAAKQSLQRLFDALDTGAQAASRRLLAAPPAMATDTAQCAAAEALDRVRASLEAAAAERPHVPLPGMTDSAMQLALEQVARQAQASARLRERAETARARVAEQDALAAAAAERAAAAESTKRQVHTLREELARLAFLRTSLSAPPPVPRAAVYSAASPAPPSPALPLAPARPRGRASQTVCSDSSDDSDGVFRYNA